MLTSKMIGSNPEKKQNRLKILQAAQLYHKNLCDKNILFVFDTTKSFQVIEAEFRPGFFAHLVGIHPASLNNKPSKLYELAFDKELKINDYEFTRDIDYSNLKLEVISRVFNIDTNGRMIGDFQEGRFVNLKTDKVLGRSNAVLGLIETGDIYVPNSVINADIREVSRNTSQILATFKKDASSPIYSELRYVSKLLSQDQIANLSSALHEQGFVSHHIICPSTMTQTSANLWQDKRSQTEKTKSSLSQDSYQAAASVHMHKSTIPENKGRAK